MQKATGMLKFSSVYKFSKYHLTHTITLSFVSRSYRGYSSQLPTAFCEIKGMSTLGLGELAVSILGKTHGITDTEADVQKLVPIEIISLSWGGSALYMKAVGWTRDFSRVTV